MASITHPRQARWAVGLGRLVHALLAIVSSLTIAAALGMFAVLAIGPHLLGYRPVTMLSGSMTPTIRPGDLVVDVPEPLSAVKVGQILTIQTPTKTGYVDSHRVISVQRKGGQTFIRTKGDANNTPDAWLAELHGTTAWRVETVIPKLGFVVNFLRDAKFHRMIVWAGPLLIAMFVIWSIWT